MWVPWNNVTIDTQRKQDSSWLWIQTSKYSTTLTIEEVQGSGVQLQENLCSLGQCRCKYSQKASLLPVLDG